MSEPAITINGVTLSEGQAMTVRVAIENFAIDLKNNSLGDGEAGIAIAKGYRDRIAEIREIIFKRTT